MDAKGRISLPAKYRTKLAASDLVLVPGMGHCLWLFTEEEYDKLIEPIQHASLYDSAEIDELRDLYISGAEDVEVDSAGRIRISAEQREYAQLDKDVTIAGKGSYLELCDSELYQQKLGKIDKGEARKALSRRSENAN